ncbi:MULTISPECIES: aromatic acid exporter family protein [Actinomadura]|uniref:Aromatic acid exporter family member 1 n=1 Tax=Actinomadura madurae TaxID=1993 RepID=A0A1I5AWH3_9ACTN|nr:aromatic acid exporter family protein [Actinomadura madurae]SFN66866.1 Aromatic acid exporter family member 1 [Actinomadura madurae]SPT57210.1 Predicted membrane protein [Actinomadura madurae]
MSLAFFRRRSGRDDRAGRSPLRVATEVQSTVFRIARLTITAVLSFVLALAVLPAGGPEPLLAPLTALLVVQSSVYQTIRASILRVAAVTAGVLVAVLAASTIGFSWWTLGLAILAALTIGHVLRLGEHVLEAPISAMLIFALGSASEAGAEDRVLETLIGAATGLAATLLVPTVRVRPAEEAVQDVAEKLRELLAGIADGLRGERAAGEAARWQEEAERLAREIGRTDRDLGAAEESVRLNPRTRARRLIDAGVALRNAMETMEHFTLSLRGLTRSLADDERLGDRGRLLTDPELRRELGDALAGIAASISAYGRLARSDLARDARPFLAEHELETRVDVARERRARLTRRLHERAAAGDLWPLYGEVSMDIDRLIENLRVEHRARAREHWRRHRGAARHLPPRPVRAVQQAGHTLRKAAGSAAAAAERNARESGERYHRP